MIFHLGPLGELYPLPVIEKDVEPEAPASAPGSEFVSLKGRRSQDRIGPHRKAYTLEWKYLAREDFDLLDAMRRGHLGGPLRLVDPQLPNLANAQVASGGTEERSVLGWSTGTGSRKWVRPANRPAGVRAVGAIEWTKASAIDELATGRDVPDYRVPAPPEGGPVTVAARIMRADAPGGFTLLPGIDAWDRAGNRTAIVQAAGVTVTGAWSDVAWTGELPPGSVSFAPMWRVALTPASVYVTGVRAGWGSTAPAPSIGGGAPVVTIGGLPLTYPSKGEFSFSVALNEA